MSEEILKNHGEDLGSTRVCLYACICVYVYIERERVEYIYIFVYVHIL